ncbi:MAG: DUF4912 domain-containing protein [Treponema sp.]|jgi:hypothetical protein|nr:DUF4912 domain-containing protein [Treponema sp.]MBR6296809.1 DUF4912 domain-containing protein [Treponema sp.]MEE3315146.1 DUF4912 domain-containing protein [Treponema sp.]
MEEKILSRQYLESISTADLISLAFDYGIDIPENLSRRFVIGELLEAAQELESETDEEQMAESEIDVPDFLPKTYNETQIYAILRNPAWAFVFWDYSIQEFETLTSRPDFKGFFLHIAFFDSASGETPSDSFDIQISPDDREQYVLIPAGRKYVIINLKCSIEGMDSRVLAYTRRIEIPPESETVVEYQPGKKVEMSELVKLSGMEELLRKNYKNHRQSFS